MADKKKNNKLRLNQFGNLRTWSWKRWTVLAGIVIGTIAIVVGILSWIDYQKFETIGNELRKLKTELQAIPGSKATWQYAQRCRSTSPKLDAEQHYCINFLESNASVANEIEARENIKKNNQVINGEESPFAANSSETIDITKSRDYDNLIQSDTITSRSSGKKCNVGYRLDNAAGKLNVQVNCIADAMWQYYPKPEIGE